jgi:glycosyltransferase involved in cell wall biosynthesis
MVITLHDLIKSEWGGRGATTKGFLEYLVKRFGYSLVVRLAVSRAAAVFVPSRFVKDKVASKFGIGEDKIHVTYEAGTLLGKGRTASEREVEDVLGRLKVSKPYLLYVGNVYPYKNVGRLLEAVKILNEEMGQKVQLVLVGARDIFRKRLEREILKKDVLKYVTLTGYISDPDLIDLYRQAESYVQPSLSEGFGLTSVEAMSLGTPVVEANASCLPEVAGDAALFFDPLDSHDIARKIAKVLEDGKLRRALSEKGLKRVRRFSWRKMAQETLKVYESISS